MMAKYQIVFIKFEASLDKISRLVEEKHFRYKAKSFYTILKLGQKARGKELLKFAQMTKFQVIMKIFCKTIEMRTSKTMVCAFSILKHINLTKSLTEIKDLKVKLLRDRLRISSGKKISGEKRDHDALKKLASQLSFDQPLKLFKKKNANIDKINEKDKDISSEIKQIDKENEMLELKIRMTEEYAENFIDRIKNKISTN